MNLEAKAKLFALYYFQQVLCTKSERFNPVYLTAQSLEFRILSDFDTDYLVLRTVKQLTDEEYKVLAKWSAYRLDDKNIIQVGKAMAKHLFELNKLSGNTISAMVDYLRSIGILIPFTTIINGEVKTYEVEEILGKNWCKVVE